MHRSLDPTFPLYPVLAFLGFIVSLIPLPWHLHAWNSGTCAFMIWTALLCLIGFINSLIWTGNVDNSAPGWCDLTTQIQLAGGIGIPAATLCISRRLYKITSVNTVSMSRDDKRKAIFVDLCIALGLPILITILHIVVQPHRFDIVEDIGCFPVTYNTLPAYFLYFMWPVVIGLVSLGYSVMVLRSFYKRRLQFNQLMSSNPALNFSRYLRLMLLAIMDVMCTIPLGIFTIYVGTAYTPLAPWISWEDTHFDFAQVHLVPTLIWRSNETRRISTELGRWLPVVCALLFFALFGFAGEAQKHYRQAFWWVVKPLGFRPASPTKGNNKVHIPSFKPISPSTPSTPKTPASGDSLPVYVIHRGAASPKSPESSWSSTQVDDVELGLYPEKHPHLSTMAAPASPASCPPAYTQSRHDGQSVTDFEDSSPSHSFMTLPDTEYTRHSVYSTPSHHTSISDAYARSPSPSILENDARHLRLHTLESQGGAYVPRSSPSSSTRVPSPAPFENLIANAYQRPFSPPSIHPVTRPHAATDGIVVTVHTESSEAL